MPNQPTFPDVLLLVDDHHLQRKRNLTRTFYQPIKCAENPILQTGQVPWDHLPLLFGSTRFDPLINCYRMWYIACQPAGPGENAHARTTVAEALSKDGTHWTRPRRDVKTWSTSKAKHAGNAKHANNTKRATNLLFGSGRDEVFIEHGSVLILPEAPASRRYVMTYCAIDTRMPLSKESRYYRLAFSGDGIHWRRGPRIPVVAPGAIDRHALLRDPDTGEFLFYFRGEQPFRGTFPTTDRVERTICLQRSKDLKNWSATEQVLAPDGTDRIGHNFYSLMPFARGRTLLGVYQLHDQHTQRQMLTLHFCWSHDGTNWHRRREEFIPAGRPGQWDRFNQAVADQPIVIDDTMHFYYSGRQHRHAGYENSKPDCGPLFSGIAMATLKLDRFASLSASFDGGKFTTTPQCWPANQKLLANVNCTWGRVEFEVIKPGQKQAYSACCIEGVDNVRVPVDLDWPVDQPARLVVRLFNANIYALYRQ